MTPRRFRKIVLDHYHAHGRHNLPWRKTHDPYRILVSEVMLQQTQVDRVIPFYENFIRSYPTALALAKAPLKHVLKHWQGLGYNRRAKMLHEAAKAIAKERRGRFPTRIEDIESLPGVGPYTARAVAAFAFDINSVFLETNIRTAIIHHFPKHTPVPSKRKSIINEMYSDSEIREILNKVSPRLQNGASPRKWYAALMDYGAYLKRAGIRTNARVKGYTKQKPFDGSLRQARGAVLRALSEGPSRGAKLSHILGHDREAQVNEALVDLTKEGLVEFARGRFQLPGGRHSVSKTKRKAPRRQ